MYEFHTRIERDLTPAYYHRGMAKDDLAAVAKRVDDLLSRVAGDEELYYDDLASELGGDEELQMALLATAITQGLIEPTDALLPILQEIEEKLIEIAEA